MAESIRIDSFSNNDNIIITITINKNNNITSCVDWYTQLSAKSTKSNKSAQHTNNTLFQCNTSITCNEYMVNNINVMTQNDNIVALTCPIQYKAHLFNTLYTTPLILQLYEHIPNDIIVATHHKHTQSTVLTGTCNISLKDLLQCKQQYDLAEQIWQLTSDAQSINTSLHQLYNVSTVQSMCIDITVQCNQTLINQSGMSHSNELVLQPIQVCNIPSYWVEQSNNKTKSTTNKKIQYKDMVSIQCRLPLSLDDSIDVVLNGNDINSDNIVTFASWHTQYCTYELCELLRYSVESNKQLILNVHMKRVDVATSNIIYDIHGTTRIDMNLLLTSTPDIEHKLYLQQYEPELPHSDVTVDDNKNNNVINNRVSAKLKPDKKAADPLPTLQLSNTYITLKLYTVHSLQPPNKSLNQICVQHINTSQLILQANSLLQRKQSIGHIVEQIVSLHLSDVTCPISIQQSHLATIFRALVDHVPSDDERIDSTQQLKLALQYRNSSNIPHEHITSLYISSIVSSTTVHEQINSFYQYALYCQCNINQPDTALVCLYRALELDQTSIQCIQLLVCVLVELDHIEQATQWVQQLNHSNTIVSQLIYALYELSNEYDGRFATLINTIDIQSNGANFTNELLVLLGESHTTLVNTDTTPLYLLASILRQLNCVTWSNTIYTICYQQQHNNRVISICSLLEHSIVLSQLHDTDRAYKYVVQARAELDLVELEYVGVSVKHDAALSHIYSLMAQSYRVAQKYDLAELMYRQYMTDTTQQHNMVVIHQYIDLLVQQEQYNHAIDLITTMLVHHSNDITLWLHLSRVFIHELNYIHSIAALIHCTTMDSNNMLVYITLCHTLLQYSIQITGVAPHEWLITQATLYMKHALTLDGIKDCINIMNSICDIYATLGNIVMVQQIQSKLNHVSHPNLSNHNTIPHNNIIDSNTAIQPDAMVSESIAV